LLSGVNEAPTAVILSNVTTSLNENTSTSSAIDLATIGVTDDGLGTNVLSLSGPDVGFFEIAGSTLHLKTGVVLNYEAKSTYSVTVNVNDASVDTTPDASAVFTLSVTNVNETPAFIDLTNVFIQESLPAGTLIGSFSTNDPDIGDAFTYTLVPTTDPTAPDFFQIVGNQLRSNASFDFEARNRYQMKVRSTDQGGLSTEMFLTITVQNVNEPPTAVVFTPLVTSVAENSNTASQQTVATISVIDDSLGAETLTLSGPHASFFTISGFNLIRRAGVVLDYEATPFLSVTVNANDASVGGNPDASGTYTLNLTNVNEAPTAISLNDDAVDEALPAGTAVGTLVTADPDASNTFTYVLVSGEGNSGNGSFQIVGDQLVTTGSFDFEAKSGYSIRLRTTDQGGLSFEQFLTVRVTDMNEAPTAVVLDRLVPEGPEFRVNTTTTDVQTAPSVAMAPDGTFVVAWQSLGQDGNGAGVYAQRYSATGVPLGSEFRVNTTTTNNQDMASIAMGPDGSFIVTWRSFNQDGSGGGVYGRRYSAAAIPLGSEFQINNTTAGSQDSQSIAIRADGSFIVVWQTPNQDGSSLGIYARRYTAAGTPVGGEFRVNTVTSGNQMRPTIAADSSGNFIIAWDSSFQEGVGNSGIYAQRYNAAGAPIGGEFRINTTTEHDQNFPSIATAADGSFVVTWMSIHQDGNSNGIYARRYDVSGAALSGEFRVNTTTISFQQFPDIEIAADGSFLIGWTSNDQDGSGLGVYAQRYNATGGRVGEEFLVNTETENRQSDPSIASDASGNVVIAWTSLEQDGSSLGVYAQRYKTVRPVVTLPENTSTASPIDVAAISVTDEGLGTNTLSLSGAQASFFELDGTTLRLKAGAVLDFEATPTLSVTVNVDDPSVGGPVDASAVYTLVLTDVNEAPTAIAQSVSVTEDGTVQISLHGSDPESPEEALVFTITSLPSYGVLRKSNGDAVVVGDTFSGSPTLKFSSDAEVTSGLVTGFTFTVQDPLGLTSPAAAVDMTVIPAVASGDVTVDANGVVRIGGTSGDDTLILNSSSGFLSVTLNGVLVSNSIPVSSISEVRAWVYEGNDVIDAQGLAVDTVLFGGIGHDTLTGGSAGDFIFGGDGDDTVTGGAGNDFLSGGTGSDRIVGSAGNDVLVAGAIGPAYSLEDVKTILADWVAGAVQTPDDSDLDDSVLAESDYDKLTGSSGADWFIIGQNDVITDFKPQKNNGDLVTSV
jgi:Ca2+-binding RTX toxin-like protein